MPSGKSLDGNVWLGRLPGLALCLAVALAAVFSAPLLRSVSSGKVSLPDMVLALVIGIILHELANRPAFSDGLTYAVKTLLRYAIALLGLRIALSDIIGLGLGPVLLVIIAMALTIFIAIRLSLLLGTGAGLGALSGAANAVCGASATLATATVVPDYPRKSADIAFTVVMANAISTLVMLAYPPLCAALGLTPLETGLMLGITIQDMAQVVGAGYAVSEPVGNSAVIVKLFRVFLLLPVVLIIGWWFATRGERSGPAKVPVPVFAFVFLLLCVVNSILPGTAMAGVYAPIKAALVEASRWMMLIAIAALGLGTSIGSILAIGWRHCLVFLAAGAAILVIGTGGLLLLR